MLSQDQIASIFDMADVGDNPTSISANLGIPRSTVRGVLERRRRPPAAAAVAAPLPTPTTSILSAPAPLSVKLPPKAQIDPSASTITAILYGDMHFPFQDERVRSILFKIIDLVQPDLIADMGDGLDCYSLSRFDKNPDNLHNLQSEVDSYRAHLAAIRLAAPKAELVVLEGNHPDRLRRTLWNLPSEAAALFKLNAVKESATWPVILGIEELGATWVPYGQESKFSFLPKFLLKHGNKVSAFSAYTARKEMENYNRSGASGHTHRLGAYYRHDHNGSHLWIETGCSCRLDPEYMADPNWQQGVVVLTFDRATGAVTPELVHIFNGLATFRGRTIRA